MGLELLVGGEFLFVLQQTRTVLAFPVIPPVCISIRTLLGEAPENAQANGGHTARVENLPSARPIGHAAIGV